jgi:hypothetical protein
MFFYKLRKLLKEKRNEVFLGSLQLSFLAAFVSNFLIIYILREESNKSEIRQMFILSFILSFINLSIIYFVDIYFDFGVIISIFVGLLISFLFYIIPSIIFIIIMEWSMVILTKEEIRDAKLGRVLRKLF